jgi:hypothetical protein
VSEVSKYCIESLVTDARAPDSAFTTWLDVVGYDRSTFQTLANALGMTHDDLSDMLLFSVPTCRNVEGQNGSSVSIVVHHAKLSLEPVPLKSGSLVPPPLRPIVELVMGGDGMKAPETLKARRLADKSAISDIIVSLEQASLLIAGERLLVTFRLPCVEILAAQAATFKATVDESAAKPAWVPFRETPGGRSANPFASDASSVRVRFEQIRQRLPTAKIHAVVKDSLAPAPAAPGGRHRRRSLEAQYNGDARFLAVLLVDALVSSNYGIRDRMQDWDELLDASIRGRQCSANTIHLQAMDTVVAHFKDMLEPLAHALNPDAWPEEGSADDAAASAAATAVTEARDMEIPPKLVDCRDAGSTPVLSMNGDGSNAVGAAARAGVVSAVSAVSGTGSDPGGAEARSLRAFFRHEVPFFKELATDVRSHPVTRNRLGFDRDSCAVIFQQCDICKCSKSMPHMLFYGMLPCKTSCVTYCSADREPGQGDGRPARPGAGDVAPAEPAQVGHDEPHPLRPHPRHLPGHAHHPPHRHLRHELQ